MKYQSLQSTHQEVLQLNLAVEFQYNKNFPKKNQISRFSINSPETLSVKFRGWVSMQQELALKYNTKVFSQLTWISSPQIQRMNLNTGRVRFVIHAVPKSSIKSPKNSLLKFISWVSHFSWLHQVPGTVNHCVTPQDFSKYNCYVGDGLKELSRSVGPLSHNYSWLYSSSLDVPLSLCIYCSSSC